MEGDQKAHDLFYVWKDTSTSQELLESKEHDATTTGSSRPSPNNSEDAQTSSLPTSETADHASTDTAIASTSRLNDNEDVLTPSRSTKTRVDLSNTLILEIAPTPAQSSAPRSDLLEKFRSGDKFVSPFKKYLIVPKTPEKNPKTKRRLRFPAMVSSQQYRDFLKKKDDEQEAKKKKKPACKDNSGTKPSNKGKALIQKKKIKDWECKHCKARWNQEVRSGFARKWIECETCLKWYHARCVSKKHCVLFGYNFEHDSGSESEDDITFICEECVKGPPSDFVVSSEEED